MPPDYHAYAQAIIDEGVRIVETAGNSPGPVIKQLKEAGCTILHKCTTIRHAQSAVKLGVDFLSIDGFECAGHVGESDITNFILLSRARQSLPVPFIASGGFSDGQGLAAALSLGAEGINMGTRFMCTIEAPIHMNVKRAIVEAREEDTELVLRRWRNTSRLFSNKVAKEAVKIEKESTSGEFDEVAGYVSGKRGREVFLNGDVDYGVCHPHSLETKHIFDFADMCSGMDSRPSHRSHPRYPHLRRFNNSNRERGRTNVDQSIFLDHWHRNFTITISTLTLSLIISKSQHTLLSYWKSRTRNPRDGGKGDQ